MLLNFTLSLLFITIACLLYWRLVKDHWYKILALWMIISLPAGLMETTDDYYLISKIMEFYLLMQSFAYLAWKMGKERRAGIFTLLRWRRHGS